MHKPNAKTITVIRKANRGEDLVECKDLEDFIKKIRQERKRKKSSCIKKTSCEKKKLRPPRKKVKI